MRIAQVAPLAEAVPPKLYGGTERVVHWLTEGLVARGHEVTLFASGDSRTSARLLACSPQALRLGRVKDVSPWISSLMREVIHRTLAGEFDLVHCHLDHWAFTLSSVLSVPVIHTMHGRMDDPDHHQIYAKAHECALVSISDSQRAPVESARWLATIHHGMPRDLFEFAPRAAHPRYALFLGRISPEKRPDLAVEVARRAGIPLRIAAKVDAADREYWESVVKPLVDSGPGVEFLGEVDDEGKRALLAGATALLFPIDWPEPFGLVTIEALACGTPVVTRPCGALPELIEEGRTGFLRAGVDELAGALVRAADLDRAECRAAFERRFSRERMVDDYERLYRSAIDRHVTPRPTIRLAA